jgi:hypothetical protein
VSIASIGGECLAPGLHRALRILECHVVVRRVIERRVVVRRVIERPAVYRALLSRSVEPRTVLPQERVRAGLLAKLDSRRRVESVRPPGGNTTFLMVDGELGASLPDCHSCSLSSGTLRGLKGR